MMNNDLCCMTLALLKPKPIDSILCSHICVYVDSSLRFACTRHDDN